MSTKRHNRELLIDGDVLAYQCAAACEKAIDWGDNYWTWHCDANEVKNLIIDRISALEDELDASNSIICLSSPHNFRHSILPSYKSNRSGVKRPLVLKEIRDWLIFQFDAAVKDGLEGDDVLGILATMRGAKQAERVIVSIDKDMKSIPGLYYRGPEYGLVEISEREANEFHMIQTLAGDPTDGYSGCPGIGMERATKLIRDEPTVLVPYDYTVTRGPRKGDTEVRYTEEPTTDLWAAVVSRYVAAGLTEQDALIQARVSRILRAQDYDFQTSRPVPWNPPSSGSSFQE